MKGPDQGVPRVVPGMRAASRRLGLVRAGAAALLTALLGCAAASSPPEPAPHRDDFDAPRPGQTASFLRVSAYREARGDLDGALRAAEQASAAGPASAAAALREAELRAAVARRADDPAGLEEARAAIESLVAEYPEAPAARLAAVRLALADGRTEQAVAGARALADERADWAAPRALLARALLAEDPREALAQAEQAAALAPSDPDALAARAAAYAAHALDRAAVVDARRALRLRSDPEVARILAGSQLRSGKARDAIETAQGVLETERSAALELLMVRAYWELEQKDAALAALERAKQRAGDDPELQADAIDLSMSIAVSEGRTREALAEIGALRRERPDDARLAETAAAGELAEGRLPVAEASARQAVRHAPQRGSGWYLLAEVLERSGARAPAEERAAAALGAGAEDAGVHLLSGLIAERGGESAAARSAYEAALARDPQLAVAALRLAQLLAAEGRDPGRAVELAEGALSEVGWRSDSAETLGNALLAAGRPTEAIAAYRIALGTFPQLSLEAEPVQLSLALALAAAGENGEAKAIAAALVGAASGREPAPPWLEGAKALRERLAGAVEATAASPGP